GRRRRTGKPVRGRARRGRNRAREGHVQYGRAAGDGARRRRAATRSGSRLSGAKIADAVAAGSSRRGFLAKVSGAVLGLAGARALTTPRDAEAFHFCGHIYTTDSCPHPTGLPRIDARGFPLKAKNGRPVDDLGRYIDATGKPVDDAGAPL